MIVVFILTIKTKFHLREANEIHARFTADSVWSSCWLNPLLRGELLVCGFGNEGLPQTPFLPEENLLHNYTL